MSATEIKTPATETKTRASPVAMDTGADARIGSLDDGDVDAPVDGAVTDAKDPLWSDVRNLTPLQRESMRDSKGAPKNIIINYVVDGKKTAEYLMPMEHAVLSVAIKTSMFHRAKTGEDGKLILNDTYDVSNMGVKSLQAFNDCMAWMELCKGEQPGDGKSNIRPPKPLESKDLMTLAPRFGEERIKFILAIRDDLTNSRKRHYSFMIAASYFNIGALVDLCGAAIASLIKGLPLDQTKYALKGVAPSAVGVAGAGEHKGAK
jgi:hypothetical protein